MDITSPEGRVALCFHQKYPKLFLKIPEIPRKIPAEILVTKSLKNPPKWPKIPEKIPEKSQTTKIPRKQKIPEKHEKSPNFV